MLYVGGICISHESFRRHYVTAMLIVTRRSSVYNFSSWSSRNSGGGGFGWTPDIIACVNIYHSTQRVGSPELPEVKRTLLIPEAAAVLLLGGTIGSWRYGRVRYPDQLPGSHRCQSRMISVRLPPDVQVRTETWTPVRWAVQILMTDYLASHDVAVVCQAYCILRLATRGAKQLFHIRLFVIFFWCKIKYLWFYNNYPGRWSRLVSSRAQVWIPAYPWVFSSLIWDMYLL